MPDDPRLGKITSLIFERLGFTSDQPKNKEDEIAAMYLRELIMPTMMASKVLAANKIRPVKIIEVLRALADGLELIAQEVDMEKNNQ